MTPEKAAKTFKWFKISPDDGVPELYLDHSMLSTLRMCEQKFMEEYVLAPNGITLSGTGSRSRGRSWSLDFGSLWHLQMQDFYTKLQETGEVPKTWALNDWLNTGMQRWIEMDMDVHCNVPGYKSMGGINQFVALLVAYYTWFGEQQEHFRVVATEVAFGKNKEVPFGWAFPDNGQFRAYLCGRIDLLVDDGYSIYPIDHKTRSRFTGHELDEYNPHEGMTGYVYATRCIMNKLFPDLIKQGKLCKSIWINHISLQYNKENQFKRSQIVKTLSQLSQFSYRQISTFKKVWDLVINERPADWDISHCTNVYHQNCSWKALHEQSPEQREHVFNAHYIENTPETTWDCYNSPGAPTPKVSPIPA